MARVALDFGNSHLKGFDPRSGNYVFARHMIAPLSPDNWAKVIKRGRIPPGFALINGSGYAIGDAARRYNIVTPPRGAARYTPDYYGVGMAYMLAATLRQSTAKIKLVATHAPADLIYAPKIEAAAKGIWTVESEHGLHNFQVTSVQTYDEPLAGYANFVLNDRGEERKRNPLAESTTLVVDVGGHTTDLAAIDPGGNIDPLSLNSTRTGALNVFQKFEQRLRAQNGDLFQDALELDPRRVESALTSGVYAFGNKQLDCADIAAQSKKELINDILQIIRGAGGAANFDYILLTGGGGQMVRDDLAAAQPYITFLMADTNPDLMRFANAFGAVKFSLLMEAMG